MASMQSWASSSSWGSEDRRSIASRESRDSMADRYMELEARIARESGYGDTRYGQREYRELKSTARWADTQTKAAFGDLEEY
ncbi:hypothetical protein ACV22V_32625, partial [Burkholderia sp. AW33-5]